MSLHADLLEQSSSLALLEKGKRNGTVPITMSRPYSIVPM
jgi:hypothetical protein